MTTEDQRVRAAIRDDKCGGAEDVCHCWCCAWEGEHECCYCGVSWFALKAKFEREGFDANGSPV